MDKIGTTPSLRRKGRMAFSLIELMVVVAIIAVLVGLALPIYGVITQRSREAVTLSNMRQIGTACLLYAGDNNYCLPNRAAAQPGQAQPDKWPKLFQQYVQNLNCYVSPIPPHNNITYQVTNPSLLTSNSTNYTSYIANGYNDLGAFTNPSIYPRLNTIALPSQTIMFGIPYPQQGQFYMDFVENGGNNNNVLSRNAFNGTSVWVFTDGSSRVLQYNAADNMAAAPKSSGYYTDWLWLINKADASIIQ